MKVLWESDNWPGTRVEPNVTCLTWMPTGVRHAGDQKSTKKGSTASSITSLPSSSSENSETNNHKPTTTWSCGRGDLRRGFLGAGSESGTVGITRTDISPFASVDIPHDKRLNFNLRGHASQISLVAWNVPQKKLASCDEAGVIYVWMPNDERWIVELVNDRGVKVRDFCWSPNGSCALICYEDNFVLIGSATGQRIWSHSFQQTVLCGVWAHDSREIVIGLSTGGIQVITEQGATVTERTVWADHPIERLACSAQRASGGVVHFLRSYDDADATVFVPEGTNVKVVGMQWSISGEHLALATVSEESKHAAVVNHLHIFNGVGARLLSTVVPLPGTGPQRRLTAFTWAHDDRAVVLAANDGHVLTGRLVHGVASLSTLASYRVWSLLDKKQMAHRTAVDELPLPKREKIMVKLLDDHLVQCRVPSPVDLMNFACRPTPWRWYCTIRPAPRKPQCYVLCMEHIGGLIPVLIGRQINRLLPEFEIRLPVSSYTSSSARSKSRKPSTSRSRSRTPEKSAGEADEREPSDTPSPFQRSTLKRNSVWRTSKRKLRAIVHNLQSSSVGAGAGPSCSAGSSDLISAAGDERLVQVSSNVWCTRFKVTGMLATVLPPYLAQVVYKTSVLHLQPRQMTVHLVDLERRTALTAPVAPPIDNDAADGGTDDNLLENQSDLGPPVAPSDGEIFAGGNFNNINNNNNNNNNFAEEEAGAFTNEGDELLVREHELLHQVSLEFTDLRLAVESHINRMKDFAADLQRSSIQLKTGGRRAAKGTDHPSSSLLLPRRSTTPLPAAPAFKDQAFVERKTAGCAHASVTSSVAKTATGQEQWVPPTPPADQSWQSKLDAIEFIDEDESLVVTSELERQRLRPRTLSASTDCDSRLNGVSGAIGRSSTDAPPTSSTARDANNDPPAYYAFSRPASLAMSGKGGAKQLNEISTVLDKLYKLANELTARPAVLKQTVSDGGRTAGTGKTTATTKSMLAVAADGVDGVSELRNRIREIAQRVSQLEKRINHGNDLLDEVRGDLHQRVQHIRVVLGEFSENTGAVDSESLPRIVCSAPSTSRASSAEPTSSTAVKKSSDTKTNQQELGRVFVLHNKTPFWNEQSQVYQLDFGGRVTQESAKNFQIEHQGVQVMQFGRIENGAYTLDFRSPFSAVQSYAVALASITQRLK